MIGTGAAILGSALIGGAASIFGSSKAANAQKSAANQAAMIQQQAMQQGLAQQQAAMDYQKGVFNESKGYLSPFIQTGQGANNLLANFYGLGGNPAVGQQALEGFYNSPDFQFALKSGTGALDNSAAAKGGLLGGNHLRALAEYGQGLGTQNLGNYLGRLGGMSQQGLTAGGYLGQIGSSVGSNILNNATAGMNSMITGANNVGQSIMGAGTAEASGYLGAAKGVNSMLDNFVLANSLGKSSFGNVGGNLPGYFGGNTPNYVGGNDWSMRF